MPRTKRPAKKQEKSGDEDDALKKLDKLVADQKAKLEHRAQMEIRNVELAFKILLGSISTEYLHKTVGELKTELHLKEAPTARQTRHSSRAASHDDGYLTENSSQSSGDRGLKKQLTVPTTGLRQPARRSRSAEASARKASAARTTHKRRSRSTVYKTPAYNKNALVNYPAITPKASARKASAAHKRRSRSTVYKTPAYNKNALVNYPAITPKVTPHTPLTVLRQPRQGEMVVSMSGSPVMVPSVCTMQPDEKANCNILLKDGTMLSLQPKQLRASQAYIPFSLMDEGVMRQLKTLKDNLEKMVRLGENAMQ